MGDKQTKRQQQKAAKAKKVKAQKRKKIIKDSLPMILITVLVILVIGVTIWIVIDSIYAGKNKDNSTTVETTTAAAENSTETGTITVDYSACLTDDGFIENVKALDYVTLPDLDSLSIDYSDVEPSEEDIASALESYNVTELVKDAGTLIEDGDKVNIDYVGYVDGVAFEGGDTQGAGTDLTIGSGQYIDDFEEQLIGYAPGDEVEVNVTFPEDYGKENLNGKDAVFNVTINGVYVTSAPTDEYVAEYYSDVASTYEELKAYVVNTLLETNIEEAVWNKVLEESEISSYPEEYMSNLIETTNYMYEYEYDYYNQYMYSLNGEYQWESIYDYYGMEQEELEQAISDEAQSQGKYYLVAQAVYEQAGLELSDDDVTNCLTVRGYSADDLENLILNYGSGYIYQSAIGDVVRAYIAEKAEIIK